MIYLNSKSWIEKQIVVSVRTL